MTFLREVFSRDGVLTILRLALVYLCIAVFWALFDQTSSAWVLQAEDMDLRWLGIDWLPSQIQVLNPILVMVLIPLFQFVVYPGVNRVFRLTPLRKIGIGLFVMTAGFGLSAVVQGWIDGGAKPSIAWQFVAYLVITSAEVMVSITGLEFSYAQAPKTMKSVIMAVWLLSVSLGNYVTAAVNHWIQVPRTEGVTTTSEDVPLADAKAKIDAVFFSSAPTDAAKAIPSDTEGAALIAGIFDASGKPIHYRRITRDRYRLVSDGPDGKPFTRDDVILLGTVVRVDPEAAARVKDKPFTWREQRLIDLKGDAGRLEVEAARGDAPETTVTGATQVGGLETLEGDAYYWFWTGCMLAAAVAFVPIAVTYRGHAHFQDGRETG
jgi:POT family proton-dependent oligopeptide transporter